MTARTSGSWAIGDFCDRTVTRRQDGACFPHHDEERDSTVNERVLLVDDEEVVLKALGDILRYLGYRVETRSNGYDALTLFLEDPAGFDLIMTDYFMPEMHGIEFSWKILGARPDIPVILMSGGDPEMELEAKAIGVREFLQKPIDIDDLMKTIGSALMR